MPRHGGNSSIHFVGRFGSLRSFVTIDTHVLVLSREPTILTQYRHVQRMLLSYLYLLVRRLTVFGSSRRHRQRNEVRYHSGSSQQLQTMIYPIPQRGSRRQGRSAAFCLFWAHVRRSLRNFPASPLGKRCGVPPTFREINGAGK